MFRVRLFNVLIFTFVISICLFVGNVAAQVGRDTDLWQWSSAAPHHQSIVQVELDGGTGTGVVVWIDKTRANAGGHEGWCLTAWHVVAGDKDRRLIKIHYRNGQSAKHCKVLASNEKNDVALVWVWVPDSIRPAPVAANAVQPGDSIEICGLGGGSALECCLRHFDTMAAVTTNQQKIFADVTLLPGDSGGPVFNEQNQVVGVVSGGWFWWDGGVTNNGSPVRATWPARTSNLQSLLDVMQQAEQSPASQVASQ